MIKNTVTLLVALGIYDFKDKDTAATLCLEQMLEIRAADRSENIDNIREACLSATEKCDVIVDERILSQTEFEDEM